MQKWIYPIGFQKRNIKIRIITPSFNHTENEINNLSQRDNIEVRSIESPFEARINILVVDKKYSLIVELKNDKKQKIYRSYWLCNIFYK